jgi:putative ABC transport system permease protein
MDLMPILSTLRRHKTAAGLIVLEIALTSAIVCNALHLINQRLTLLNNDTGLPEAELVVLQINGTGGPADLEDVTARDLQALRSMPGVKNVSLVNQMVYGNNSNNSSVNTDPDRKGPRLQSASHYWASEGGLQTLGLKLLEGRDFKPEEFQSVVAVTKQEKPNVPQVIINRDAAVRLFPDQSAVGKTVYVYGTSPSTVVGVIDKLPHPYPGRRAESAGNAVLYPLRPNFRGGVYMLRVDPAQRDAVIKGAPKAVEGIDDTRIVRDARPLLDMRREFYAQDRAMVGLMGGVIVALMVVTAFGIVGLASFWVAQRTRMIGTRRALGATRGQILRYFQLENFMLSSAGIAIGMAGAMALSLWLMRSYEVPRLPWSFLPLGALALWALGQAAVLAPARRAAALPPVAALRS